jgi:hypothetical protein
MAEGDPSELEAACNRQAERQLPAGTVLDAATAIPEYKQRFHRALREYSALIRAHPERPMAADDLARTRELSEAVRSARAAYTAAGERYSRLAHEREDTFKACMASTA